MQLTSNNSHSHFGAGQPVDFRLLGPVTAYLGDQRFELGARRERCLLVALLSAQSQPVSRVSLMTWIWDDPTPNADRDLNKLMGSLRRHLEAIGLREVLISRDGLCRLEVAADAVDAHRFEALVGRAWRLAGEARVELLAEALGMFHGEPLAGLPGRRIAGYRGMLADSRRRALIECKRAELQLGQLDRLVPDLTQLARADPLDEQVAGLLMVAHHRTGNRQGALSTFRAIQRRVRDEFGAEVSTELKELHQRILAGDRSLGQPSSAPGTEPGSVTSVLR